MEQVQAQWTSAYPVIRGSGLTNLQQRQIQPVRTAWQVLNTNQYEFDKLGTDLTMQKQVLKTLHACIMNLINFDYAKTGSFSTVVAANSSATCRACPPGSFSNITGSWYNSCSPCPNGTFASQSGSSSCARCSAGWAMRQAF